MTTTNGNYGPVNESELRKSKIGRILTWIHRLITAIIGTYLMGGQ